MFLSRFDKTILSKHQSCLQTFIYPWYKMNSKLEFNLRGKYAEHLVIVYKEVYL
jgi:hypothetical protein